MRLKQRLWIKYPLIFVITLYIVLFCNLPDISIQMLTNWNIFYDCLNTSTQDFTIVNDERWISIGNIFYTSALYMHDDKQPYIRLIGIQPTSKRVFQKIYCQFWLHSSGNKAKITSVAAILRGMPEHRERRFSGAYIDCLVPRHVIPFAVSLTGEHCAKQLNFIPVVNYKHRTKEYTVCVTPLNYKYSNVHQLVEMIEFNKILGAELIVFYNYSTHWNVDVILEYYRQQGFVEIIQWHLPVKVDTWPKKWKPEIHYFGQLPALNDCLHRNAQRSNYVVFQDLDEFIIPRKGYFWKDMMESLPKDKNAFIFRNAFFRKDWPDNNLTFIRKQLAIKYKATTLLKSRRERKILEYLQRSKYIVKPKAIDTVGIHNIYRYRNGKPPDNVHYVDSNYGLLHHYRDWENPEDYHTGTDDPYTLQYSNGLIEKLHDTWSKLKNITPSLRRI